MKREDIRLEFFKITKGGTWVNSKDEPDIDYVHFLEDAIIDLKSKPLDLKKLESKLDEALERDFPDKTNPKRGFKVNDTNTSSMIDGISNSFCPEGLIGFLKSHKTDMAGKTMYDIKGRNKYLATDEAIRQYFKV